MQGTGNSKTPGQNILSIRLSGDGLCFWTGDVAVRNDGGVLAISKGGTMFNRDYTSPSGPLGSAYIEESVEAFRRSAEAERVEIPEGIHVYIDTHKTVLIPSAIYEPGLEDNYLSYHNLRAGKGEQTDVSGEINGTVAVMVSSSSVLAALGKCFGRFSVISPLQYNIARLEDKRVSGCGSSVSSFLYLCPDNVFITVAEGAGTSVNVLYNSFHPCAGIADLLYYAGWLEQKFGIARGSIYIDGTGAEETASKLIRAYRTVQCG